MHATSEQTTKQIAKSEHVKPETAYRCGLQAIFKILKLVKEKNGLTKKQVDILKKTPFYNFFKVIYEEKITMKECKKHQQNLDALYNCYCMETDTFILGEDKMKVTARDISLLFGLPLKGINIEPTKKLTSRTIPPDCKEFATRNFGTNTYITRNVVERRIKQEISKRKKENEEDLPLLIVMQILLTFFFPNNQQKLRWGILPYLIDSETMQTVSWPETIENFFL